MYKNPYLILVDEMFKVVADYYKDLLKLSEDSKKNKEQSRYTKSVLSYIFGKSVL